MKNTILMNQLILTTKAQLKSLTVAVLFAFIAINSYAQQVSIALPNDGIEGTSNVSFTIFLEGGITNTTGAPITGGFQFLGTATNGVDYTAPAFFSIPVGAALTTLTLNVIDDAILELTEGVTVLIGALNVGTVFTAASTANIIDDEVGVISIGSPVDAVEGTSDVSFSISLDGGMTNTIGLPITGSINYSGIASNGTDYTSPTTFSIAPGSNSTTITVSVIDDAVPEPTETVIATISAINIVNGTIGNGVSTANIIDNDSGVLVTAITIQGQAGVSTITTPGGTLQMEATVLPANADDATYTWSVANGTGSASISATGLLIATTNGTVIVTATANDASSTIGTKVITISNQSIGVSEQTIIQRVSIYPNPVNSLLTIESEEIIERVTIINLMGKIVETVVKPNNEIDISYLTTGVYFLQVHTKKDLVSKRIIKK